LAHLQAASVRGVVVAAAPCRLTRSAGSPGASGGKKKSGKKK
jgi:hypothetical protein